MDDGAHDDGDGDVSPPPPEQLAALQAAVVAHSGHLSAISRAPARSWLAAQLDTEQGTDEVLERLQAAVDAPAFLDKLATPVVDASMPSDGGQPCVDVTQRKWWSWRRGPSDSAAVAEALLASSPPESSAAEALDTYVMVSHDDVIDALADFIARLLASHPDAAHLSPKQLQAALGDAVRVVRRSKMRRLWDWGRSIQRWSVWTYGVVKLADNPVLPWVAQALCYGLWTAARVAVGLVC